TIFGPVSSGNLVMSGGEFRSAGIDVFIGDLRQSGGTNETGAIGLPRTIIGGVGGAQYFLSGGLLLSSNLSLGAGSPGGFGGLNGVFNQSGGIHSNSGGIVVLGTIRQAQARANGLYRLSAGLLVTPSIESLTGSFEQSGGTNHAGVLSIRDASTFMLSGGTLLCSNAAIGPGFGGPTFFRNLRAFYTQTGGSLVANEFSSTLG